MESQCTLPEVATELPEDVLLSVQNVRVWFELRRFGLGVAGYVRAVDGVNFDLRRGEAVAIVGESGCGKSSLMRTILGLHRPREGRILFDGQDISRFSRKKLCWYRTRVGYVQQDPYGALPPFMNTQTLLEEPLIVARLRNRNQRLERIHKALEEVKMTPVEDFLSKFPHQLSGGQQQRVVIARAILMDPQLLVADEPVSMLDASVRVEILTLLRELQERHRLSVMYITHDLSTVRYFSERIFVMYAGKIVEKGSVDNLIENPRHPYTWALLAAIPEPDAENAKRFRKVPPGEPPSLIHPPPGCRFHPRCEKMISGLCDAQEPPEFEVGPNHQAACWLYR
ncbi:MAG: ABC transporter ATP-binding protein [Thermoflexia bacterium]|nr:MAG: ABC transporter ATP-binding protein [Thermoflexia bacterium]